MDNGDQPVTRAVLDADLSQLELKLVKQIHRVEIKMSYMIMTQVLVIIGSVITIVKAFT